MASGEGAAFAAVEGRWLQRLGSVRNVVRQELVTRQLWPHLPPVPVHRPVRVLDVGCGQGTQALRLARAGYAVTGLDRSGTLLAQARAALAAEPATVRQRVQWVQADVFDVADQQSSSWDVVCCHGVVMYLSSLHAALVALVGLACPGGLVSVLTRNQANLAMRAGMSGHWHEALAGFDAEHYTNRLGLAELRADQPAAVQAGLEAAGAETRAWYGIRLFTDHWQTEDFPADYEAVLEAETQAGCRDPYRQLAALTHTLATRHE